MKRWKRQEQLNAAWERAAERFLRFLPWGVGRGPGRRDSPKPTVAEGALRNRRPLTSFLPWPRAPRAAGSSVPGLTRARPALAEQEVLRNRHLVPESITARGPAGHLRADIRCPLALDGSPAACSPRSHVNGERLGLTCREEVLCVADSSEPVLAVGAVQAGVPPPLLSPLRSQGSPPARTPVLGDGWRHSP